MTPTSRYIALGFLGCISLLAGASVAQQPRPPAPDLTSMADALKVPQDRLAGCLGDRPAPGTRPPPPDAGKIAACLAKAGHEVASSDVAAALDRAAPARR
ncbi:hypothetical protein [Marinovum sp.]|uniref:hypothetical protein n=1 Tax=Marinovum sp. TaxID=2024839 RepID=UPI002B27B82A|nr:hypothetical protein [Marinovum sp.]